MRKYKARMLSLKEFMELGEFDKIAYDVVYLKSGLIWNPDMFEDSKQYNIFTKTTTSDDFYENTKWDYRKELLTDIEEFCDPADLKVDDKIIVWDDDDGKEHKRHFAKYENGRVYCYEGGVTSWTQGCINPWDNWRLPKDGE